MQFNGEANNQDLYSDCRYLCGIDSSDTTTFSINDFTRLANLAGDYVSTLIMRADTRWEWDDANNTDLPIATTDLVDGQQDYSVATTQLKLARIRIKDAQGNYQTIKQVNRRNQSDGRLNATNGMPGEYSLIGNSIMLDPKPAVGAVTLAKGLELQFQRGFAYFTPDDTTKAPGFASPFHRLISLYPALDYCETNELDKKVVTISRKIATLEAAIVEHYASRAKDEQPNISITKEDYGQSAL